MENLNRFDILLDKNIDFGDWKDLTLNLTKVADDSKYSSYIIYTGQGNQISNSLTVFSLNNLEICFDTYQSSKPSRIGVAYAIFSNSNVRLTMLEGVSSGDGITKIIALKKI